VLLMMTGLPPSLGEEGSIIFPPAPAFTLMGEAGQIGAV
jgi:hypothetical protein